MAEFDAEFTLDNGALERVVQPIMARVAARLTRRIAAQAKTNVPVLTGNLGRSIAEMPLNFTGPFRLETGVEATADYAVFVHEGTRPHVIKPRQANALRFQVGSQVVFARSVNHPGTTARPFLANAADEVFASDPDIQP